MLSSDSKKEIIYIMNIHMNGYPLLASTIYIEGLITADSNIDNII